VPQQLLSDPRLNSLETTRRGWGYVEIPPGAEDDDWSLPVSDDELRRETGSASAAAPVAPRTNQRPKPGLGWASTGVLMSALVLGTLIGGLPQFVVLPAAPQEVREAQKNAEVPADKQAAPADADKIPSNKPAEAPVIAPAPEPAADTRPAAKASLYDRVRQVVLDHKTEETERLGMGDVAYQDVPEDGSIMVGMEVTYKPFFTHNVIKSVRPIYQRPDGTRYDGAMCGVPTGDGERVVAKEGYAIAGAAIKSGMGIDGMQLTFMEIGPDGLNSNKSYLSKWLGGYGGANARTLVNDGRPIVGVAGMWSRTSFGPAFCLGLVTTRPGSLAEAPRRMVQIVP
jgi:hypothetical protein